MSIVTRQLQVKLLGTFEIRWRGELVPRFRTDKIRALFGYLCIESSKAHRRDALCEMFWYERESKAGKQNLRQSLYRIKQTLEKHEKGLGDKLFTTSRQELAINAKYLAIDAIDLLNGSEEISSRKEETETGDLSGNSKLEALAEMHDGEFLEGMELIDEPLFNEWLRTKREQIHKRACELFERVAQHYRQIGILEKAHQWLDRWLSIETWNERAHRLKMEWLAQEGKRSAALAQYHELVEILLEEFQADPTEETNDLYLKIHYEEVQREIQKPSANRLFSIPNQSTPFIGRKRELEELVHLLSQKEVRLVTLQGLGGIGKTRLLFEVAKELALQEDTFTDGSFFIPLAAITRAEQVPAAIAHHLQLSIQASIEERTRVIDFLRDRNLLLLLDNFEQVVEARSFLQEILETSKGVKLLVSSRNALNVKSEHRFVLKGLLAKSAQELFIQQAKRLQRNFDETSQRESIAKICEFVECSPLAIELAAGWIRMMNTKSILRELPRDPAFLQTDFPDIPERQRSMFIVFNYTWGILTDEEQELLAKLSIFQGNFSVQAVREILAINMRRLAGLVDKTLLRWDSNQRYSLHTLLRQFVSQKRAGLRSEKELKLRYSDYYLQFLIQQAASLLGDRIQIAIRQIRTEWDNIQQAWNFAVQVKQFRSIEQAARSLCDCARYAGMATESQGLFELGIQALEKSEHQGKQEQILFFKVYQIECHIEKEEFQQASNKLGELTQSIHANTDPPDLIAIIKYLQARLKVPLGKYDEAIELSEEVLQYFRSKNEHTVTSEIKKTLSRIYILQGKYNEAIEILEQGIAGDRSIGFTSGIISKLDELGGVHIRLGHLQSAKEHLINGIELAQKIGSDTQEAHLRSKLGPVLYELGANDESVLILQKAHQIFHDLGMRISQLKCLNNIAVIQAKQGNYQQAEEKFLQVTIAREQSKDSMLLGGSYGNIGQLYLDMGEEAKAEKYIRAAIKQSRKLGQRQELASGIGSLGTLYVYRGELGKAEEYLKESIDLYQILQQKLHLCLYQIKLSEVQRERGNTQESERKL